MKTPYGAFFYTHFRKSPAFRRVFSYPAAPARRPGGTAKRVEVTVKTAEKGAILNAGTSDAQGKEKEVINYE